MKKFTFLLTGCLVNTIITQPGDEKLKTEVLLVISIPRNENEAAVQTHRQNRTNRNLERNDVQIRRHQGSIIRKIAKETNISTMNKKPARERKSSTRRAVVPVPDRSFGSV